MVSEEENLVTPTTSRSTPAMTPPSPVDTTDPFYIHHTDHPGLVLVSKSLDGLNYLTRRRSMILALDGRNKLGFVDGSIPIPDSSDTTKLHMWKINDNIVASWILNSLTKEISASVIYSTSASNIWNDLEKRFNIKNGPRIFQLRKRLLNCVQGMDSINIYFTRFKGLWAELGELKANHSCNCGGVAPLLASIKEEFVMSFLMGVNESFAHARGQILLMKPILDIDETFSLLLQDETQRLVGVQPNSAPPAKMACVVTQSNAKGKPTRKDRPFCSHCNIHGHTREKCFKIHGYPLSFKKSRNTSAAVNNILEVVSREQSQSWSQQQCQNGTVALLQAAVNNILALLQAQMAQLPGASQQDPSDTVGIETIGMSNSTLNSPFQAPNAWIVDSGATSHITCFPEFLFNFKFLKNNQMELEFKWLELVLLG